MTPFSDIARCVLITFLVITLLQTHRVVKNSINVAVRPHETTTRNALLDNNYNNRTSTNFTIAIKYFWSDPIRNIKMEENSTDSSWSLQQGDKQRDTAIGTIPQKSTITGSDDKGYLKKHKVSSN